MSLVRLEKRESIGSRSSVPSFVSEINFNEVKNMALQIGSLKKSGTPYGIGIGNLTNEDQLVQKDPLAMKVFNLLMKDAQTWVGNPKRSNSAAIAPIFDLSYKSVYDIASKGDKTHAGLDKMSLKMIGELPGPTLCLTTN